MSVDGLRRRETHWPQTRITIRENSHYGRPEVMACCDVHGVDYIFRQAENLITLHKSNSPPTAPRADRLWPTRSA